MTTLVEMISAPQRRDAIIADCVRRAEAQVASAGGIRGLSLKAGLRALKAVRPDALTRATGQLLPKFAAALEPLHREFLASGEKNFAGFLEKRRAQARDAILAVTDARADAGTHRVLIATYRRLRPALASEIEKLLPELIGGIGRQLR